MRVDRRGARLQPHARWTMGFRNRLSDDARRQHAGIENLASIRGGVPAVDAATREVDHGIAPVDLPPQFRSVAPSHNTTRHGRICRRRLRTTTSWPSCTNARASTVPPWPDPPGMTIFM